MASRVLLRAVFVALAGVVGLQGSGNKHVGALAACVHSSGKDVLIVAGQSVNLARLPWLFHIACLCAGTRCLLWTSRYFSFIFFFPKGHEKA